MKKLIAAGMAFALVALPAVAQESLSEDLSDAEYVVSQLATAELFDTVFSALAGVMTQSIDLEFRKQGRIISPDSLNWMSETMGNEMGVIMAERVRDDYVATYSSLFSPEVLADLRAFLETPSGQQFASSQSVLAREGGTIGEKHGESIAREASAIMIEKIQRGEFPDEMAVVTQNELKGLFSE